MASNKHRSFRPNLEALEDRLPTTAGLTRFAGALPFGFFAGQFPLAARVVLRTPLPPPPARPAPLPANHEPPIIFNPTKLEPGRQIIAFNPTKLEPGIPIPGFNFTPTQTPAPASTGGLTVIYT